MPARDLPAAAHAFDAIADSFDDRFRPWRSVAAQRRAVHRALAKAFPSGSRLLEIGGGTGDDALWLADRAREVLMTDASPAMVQIAAAKFNGRPGALAQVAAAEALVALADQRERERAPLFDGAYSNFAGLNCVTDLSRSPVGSPGWSGPARRCCWWCSGPSARARCW